MPVASLSSQEKTITTARLVLRQFRESDFDEYAEMFADEDVMRYLHKPLTRNEAWRNMAMVLGHWQLRGFGPWAVEEKTSGAMIGRIGCWCPEGWPGCEVGWMLRRNFWGKGFATEGARAAMEYAFDFLQWPSALSVIHPENFASQRVAMKLGESFESDAEVAGVKVQIYSVNRENWYRVNS